MDRSGAKGNARSGAKGNARSGAKGNARFGAKGNARYMGPRVTLTDHCETVVVCGKV